MSDQRAKILDEPATFATAVHALGVSGAIETQEALGQSDVVNGNMLPRIRPAYSDERLIALGFQLHEHIDELWQRVTFPAGWKIERKGDTSYWSYVIDSQGRDRMSIFYKAAVYDRVAEVHARCFYRVGIDVKANVCYAQDAAGSRIHVEPWPTTPVSNRRPEAIANHRVTAFLDATYPLWRDPHAYW